jgi:hypothetical protein
MSPVRLLTLALCLDLSLAAFAKASAAEPSGRAEADTRREAIAAVVWYFDQEFAKPDARRNSLLGQFLGDRTIADLRVHRAELDREHFPPCCRVWLGRPADQIERWDLEANFDLTYRLVSGWGQGSKFDFYFPDWVQRQMSGPDREHLCVFQFVLDAQDQPRLRLMNQWNYEPKEELPAIDDAKAWEKVALEYVAKAFGRAPAGKLETYSPKNPPPDHDRPGEADARRGPFLRFRWTEQRNGQAADAQHVMNFEVNEQAANRYWVWCSDSDPATDATARPE